MRFAEMFDESKPDDLFARQAWGGEQTRFAFVKGSYGAHPVLRLANGTWAPFEALHLTTTDLLVTDWVKVPRL